MKNYVNPILQVGVKKNGIRWFFLLIYFVNSSWQVHAQAHITMSMMNCQAIGTNQLQFDVVVVNDGVLPIKLNSATIRFNYGNAPSLSPASPAPTYSWGYVNTTWPGWGNSGAYTWNATNRFCSFSSSTGFFTSSTTAPDLPINVPVTLGRYYFQTSVNFTANVPSQITWATTAGITGWVNGAATTSSIICAKAMPCNILLNPTGTLPCPNAVTVNVTNPTCGNLSGSAQINLQPSNAIPAGNYTINGGPSTAFNSNPFIVSPLLAGNYTFSLSAVGGCTPVSTTFTVLNGANISSSYTN